jgi:hypothetical protein
VKRRWLALAWALCACGGSATPSGDATFTAALFPDAGPSLAVALLQPLPGASFSSGSDIAVTAAIQALGSPVQSCELRVGAGRYQLSPPVGTTAAWNVATSPFDAGVYQLEVTVGDGAGNTASASRTISITP